MHYVFCTSFINQVDINATEISTADSILHAVFVNGVNTGCAISTADRKERSVDKGGAHTVTVYVWVATPVATTSVNKSAWGVLEQGGLR